MEFPSLPNTSGARLKIGFLACVIVFGGMSGGCQISSYFKNIYDSRTGIFHPRPQLRLTSRVPTSKLPGPERKDHNLTFSLDAENALRLVGRDDPEQERWCDISDNFYTRRFVAKYSNTHAEVYLRVEPSGPTLKGRIEAKGLKPNFAYQIKLAGDFKDRVGFENIGKVGRWRLPGFATNYTDEDYEELPENEKHKVEAYVLFDYFVTNDDGEAVRDFELDSSLHVLWRNDQDDTGLEEGTSTVFTIDASDPVVYSSPKFEPGMVGIWAEREYERYTSADQRITLPPHDYQAFIVLTEESFHAYDSDGGYWATVFEVPIAFTVVQDDSR